MGYKHRLMKEQKYYTKDFYDGIQDKSYSSAKRILSIVNEYIHPESVIDIGCGAGNWLRVWKEEYGIEKIKGYEGPYLAKAELQIPKDKIIFQDLKLPLPNEDKYDLAMTLEVAEHLPAENADKFVSTLTTLSDVVLFSAAIIGQEGTYHINEQMPDYWAAKFEQHYFYPFDCIRSKVWNDEAVESWYQQNAILYAKKDTLVYDVLLNKYGIADKSVLLRIHPNTYMHKVKIVEKTNTLPKFIFYRASMIKKEIFKFFNV